MAITTKRATLLAVCVSTFMLPLDYTVVSVALDDIRGDLGATFSELQWVVNGYTLTFAALLLTGGSLADRFGRRRVFALGLAAFGVASLSCGLAGDALVLNLARGLQGIAAAVMFSAALPLLVQEFEGSERARAFGVFGAVVGVGAALGPFLGGVVVEVLGWRWAFLLNVPVVAVILAITPRVRESRDVDAGRVDVRGFASFTAVAFLFVYALINGNELGWGDARIVGAIAASVVLLAAFVAVELRQHYPAFDVRLFADRTFVGASIVPVILSVAFWGVFLFVPLYYQQTLGYSPLEAGLAMLPFAFPLLIMGPVGARLAGAIAPRALLALGQALVAAGIGWIAIAGLGGSWTSLVGPALVAGSGTGLINGEMSNVAMSLVPEARSGMASGINSTMRQVGIALGFAGFGSIIVGVGSLADGLETVTVVAALVATAGAVATYLLMGRRSLQVPIEPEAGDLVDERAAA